MAVSRSAMLEKVPGLQRILRLPQQLLAVNPFKGDAKPSRVPLFVRGSRRPSLPFPHPWNYERPIDILDTYFHGAELEEGPARHNRYLEFPGFSAVLVTRDPAMIRAILTATGDREGQFDRDSLPSTGIARATGKDTLLFANGSFWRRQRKIAASPFGKTGLYQDEVFHEFAETLRRTAKERLAALRQHFRDTNETRIRIEIEPEIKALMLEMLVICFFGARIDYEQIRDEYVPALERVIQHIVRDTVVNRLGIPAQVLARVSRRFAQAESDFACFDRLTDLVLDARSSQAGLWKRFKSDAPDEALRSNIKVFLAGALEATTSYATWAISHLARNRAAQDRVFQEVQDVEDYSPESLKRAPYFAHVLDETLRLTPSLYFLPRRATADLWVETADGQSMFIPRGTHILLDIWHANRHEDHWGVQVTRYPALEFVPERWENLADQRRGSKEMLHFGFGHGARVCPGKHLGQLEVSLVVGAFVKLFRFQAVNQENPARAGVSTKPLDGTLVELELR